MNWTPNGRDCAYGPRTSRKNAIRSDASSSVTRTRSLWPRMFTSARPAARRLRTHWTSPQGAQIQRLPATWMIASAVVRGTPVLRPRIVIRAFGPNGTPAVSRNFRTGLNNATCRGTRPPCDGRFDTSWAMFIAQALPEAGPCGRVSNDRTSSRTRSTGLPSRRAETNPRTPARASKTDRQYRDERELDRLGEVCRGVVGRLEQPGGDRRRRVAGEADPHQPAMASDDRDRDDQRDGPREVADRIEREQHAAHGRVDVGRGQCEGHARRGEHDVGRHRRSVRHSCLLVTSAR